MNKQVVGFRIVKLVSKEPAGQRELADPRVQQAIRAQLRDRREQLLKAAYYEVLRNQAKVENYYAEKVLEGNGTSSSRRLFAHAVVWLLIVWLCGRGRLADETMEAGVSPVPNRRFQDYQLA